jgi:hypothetical protein
MEVACPGAGRPRRRRRPCQSLPDAQVDAFTGKRSQGTELLGHHEREVIGEHDAAGADPDGLRRGSQPGDKLRWSHACERGRPVMLCYPEPAEAQALSLAHHGDSV